jgi:hypothetical protein
MSAKSFGGKFLRQEQVRPLKKPENESLEALFSADREDFAQWGRRTTKLLADYLNELPEGAPEHPIPPEQRQLLSSLPLPNQGMGGDEIISFLEKNVLPWPQPTGHQRSYGWVNSPPMPISIIAESVTQTMNSALDGFDFSGLYLMASLGRWLMDLVGFPDGDQSMAMLFSGGSAANLNALTAARYWAAREDGWNLREQGLQGGHPAMICYTSDQAHSSIQRCIEQLGLGTDNLRAVPTDHRFRMDVDALKDMIASDRQAGLRPVPLTHCTRWLICAPKLDCGCMWMRPMAVLPVSTPTTRMLFRELGALTLSLLIPTSGCTYHWIAARC